MLTKFGLLQRTKEQMDTLTVIVSVSPCQESVGQGHPLAFAIFVLFLIAGRVVLQKLDELRENSVVEYNRQHGSAGRTVLGGVDAALVHHICDYEPKAIIDRVQQSVPKPMTEVGRWRWDCGRLTLHV